MLPCSTPSAAAQVPGVDPGLFLEAAGGDVDLVGTRAALAHLDAAIAAGRGDEDMATLYSGLEGQSGRTRRRTVT